ncbi:hypothetical protein DPMN_034728 [Dreissena polymorpha]|uniref:Uncharacterized protein n=1 Tax=Dreissena polymorpha TaxID=45954 RepID=A0A9D4M874_DREPO|nr:hypothetical protein DPMN_034728 [Dreissena polymorpha]
MVHNYDLLNGTNVGEFQYILNDISDDTTFNPITIISRTTTTITTSNTTMKMQLLPL